MTLPKRLSNLIPWPSLSNMLKIITILVVVFGFIMAREVGLSNLSKEQENLAKQSLETRLRVAETDVRITDLRIAVAELTVEVRHLRETIQQTNVKR